MDIEQLTDFCLTMPNSVVETPFGPTTMVFKIYSKIFALIPLDAEVLAVNLKNLPEKNANLCEEYEGIIPGYHMNKLHWITCRVDSDVKTVTLKQLITESYEIVLASIPLKKRSSLEQ